VGTTRYFAEFAEKALLNKTLFNFEKAFFDRAHDTLTCWQVRAILFARHVNIHQEIEVAGGDESRRGLDPFEPVVSIPAEIIQFV
jgi:hypothetical protein